MIICPDWASYFSLVETISPLSPPSPSRDRDGIGRRDILAYITIAVIFLELEQHSLSITSQACSPSGFNLTTWIVTNIYIILLIFFPGEDVKFILS